MANLLGNFRNPDGGKTILKHKFGESGYGPFGFFEADKIPKRPCFGYERELKAGMGLCYSILDHESTSLLVFGIPGTGKTLYPCTLANMFNSAHRQTFSLAYIQCLPEYYSDAQVVEKLHDELCKLIRTVHEQTPSIIHLVELDKLDRLDVNGNGIESLRGRAILARLLRVLFSKGIENSLLVATASFPERLDPVFLSRFDNIFYIKPTPKDHIVQIISQILQRDDSQNIVDTLLEYFSEFGMVPLGRDVLRACRLIQLQYPNVNDLKSEEVAVLLKRFISPFPIERISTYETEHKPLREKCDVQLNYWLKFFQARSRE